MHVFKFGGASVKDADGVVNLANIISNFPHEKLVIVVSAMGKTTNALEVVVEKCLEGVGCTKELDQIKDYHRSVATTLLGSVPKSYERLEGLLQDAVVKADKQEPAKSYDSIVPFGELLSTTLIAEYLNTKTKCKWVDARTLIRTDQYFTEANVDWVVTERQINDLLSQQEDSRILITQGFIGSDVEGNITTLGREGSDFTAAVLAHCMNAKQLTVWKDVPGILNADPRILSDTNQYDFLSYREVTEMTYYGAQVIHPKTLKPLAQKQIPLVVRSFVDHKKSGTVIGNQNTSSEIPCFVFKGNQVLVTAEVKDHSFMEEKKLGLILQVLDLLNIKINLMQNSALTLSFCIDDKPLKLKRIKELLNRDFLLSFEQDLSLATIKNYHDTSFASLPENRTVLMEQKTQKNYQVLYRMNS
ncbi:MAG: aspartate kinase, partial [Bacteroidota bacterium]